MILCYILLAIILIIYGIVNTAPNERKIKKILNCNSIIAENIISSFDIDNTRVNEDNINNITTLLLLI